MYHKPLRNCNHLCWGSNMGLSIGATKTWLLVATGGPDYKTLVGCPLSPNRTLKLTLILTLSVEIGNQ